VAVAIRTGISNSSRALIEYLSGSDLLGKEHEARCQALLALASQIDLETSRLEASVDAKGPAAAMWTAYERMLAGLEALAPPRELSDDAMPGLDPVSDG
jgi:hypothetical protein